MADDYDYRFKLVIIGDSGVGKTSLLDRFAQDTFKECNFSAIRGEFQCKTITLDNKKVKLMLWDTAGQERFRSITRAYYRAAHGIVLVYDVTNQESFKNVEGWLQQINDYDGVDVDKMILGNKCDLQAKRAVEYATAKEYADEVGIPLFETSAKESTNVEQAYMTLIAEMKQHAEKQQANVTLHETPPNAQGYWALSNCSC